MHLPYSFLMTKTLSEPEVRKDNINYKYIGKSLMIHSQMCVFISVTAIIALKILTPNPLSSRDMCLKFKLNFKFGMQLCFCFWELSKVF